MALPRRPGRSRPIRLFLIVMFVVPLVSLVALWAFAASTTIANAVSDHYYNQGVTIVTNGFSSLTAGLPQERAQSYLWLSSGRTTPNTAMLAARKVVDRGIPVARAAVAPARDQLSDQSKTDLNVLFGDLGQIGRIREQVDAGTMTPVEAFQAFTKIINEQWQFYFAGIKANGSPFADVSIGSTDMSYALEMGAREAVLVGGAFVQRGQMTADARQQFAAAAAARSNLMSVGAALLTPDLNAVYAPVTSSGQYQSLQSMEDEISADSGNGLVPVTPGAWQAASGAFLAGMQKAGLADGIKLSQLSSSLGTRLVIEAILAGGLGLVAVIASVFLLVWFGRKVRQDLAGLDDSVRNMASERLPRVVERLRRGEDVDVAAESPPPAASTVREISQIAESFATVQAAAVTAAVDQARLRKGVNQVFLNISMRNQSLLHRQLGMLDSMERRTSEPEALADLFRIDHLTTRMRRHAEGLIILSGSVPGRGWRDPVPVIDVMRAAVAEVEDYVRVDVNSESDDLVAGSAVSDVIHLIAELVENATVFSPPNTRIEVRAERVGTGLVAEVEDRGLGLSATELDDINRRLAASPEFDLARSDQLGLYVVSQLAARHDIKVSLRRSVYGGTTAVVLLPFGVIVREDEAPPVRSDQVEWVTDSGRALTGRHRLPAPNRVLDRPLDLEPPLDLDRPLGLDRPAAAPVTAPLAPWEIGPPPTLPTAAGPVPSGPPWDTETTDSWPAITPDGSGPREPEGPGATPSDSHLGMPIRVPQASLAPQLQGQRDAAPAAKPSLPPWAPLGTGPLGTGPEAPPVRPRSPEATRNMLNLMQQGWRRGRVDDLDHPDGAPDNGTDR
jgi:signal transduction histidine kinase